MRTVYANALLSDGKILFWYTGAECKDWHDFYKDFYYAGLNMIEYEKSHRLELDKIGFEIKPSIWDYNNFIFEVLADVSTFTNYTRTPKERGGEK